MYYRSLDWEPNNADDFGSVSLENIVSSISTLLFIAIIFELVSNLIKYFGGGLMNAAKSIWNSFTASSAALPMLGVINMDFFITLWEKKLRHDGAPNDFR